MFEADTYFDLGKKIYVHWALGIRSSCEPSWKTGRPIAWDFSIMEYCFSDPFNCLICDRYQSAAWEPKVRLKILFVCLSFMICQFFSACPLQWGMLEYPPPCFSRNRHETCFTKSCSAPVEKNKAVMGNIWNMWGANYSPVTWQIATSVDNSLRFFGSLKEYLLIFGTGRGQIVITDTWQYATS